MEKSCYLKRRGWRCFCGHTMHLKVTVVCTLSLLSSFPSDKCFLILFKLKRIMYNYYWYAIKIIGHHARWKENNHLFCYWLIAWEKILLLCMCTRSFAHTDDMKIVHSRDAQWAILRNHLKNTTHLWSLTSDILVSKSWLTLFCMYRLAPFSTNVTAISALSSSQAMWLQKSKTQESWDTDNNFSFTELKNKHCYILFGMGHLSRATNK